jgi:hypothetical protein
VVALAIVLFFLLLIPLIIAIAIKDNPSTVVQALAIALVNAMMTAAGFLFGQSTKSSTSGRRAARRPVTNGDEKANP